MKTFKYLVIVVLVLNACSFLQAERKAKPKTLDELSNPASPSYVPYPYPKNRTEVIADYKYYIKNSRKRRNRTTLNTELLNSIDSVVNDLFQKNSKYTIKSVSKVKNRSYKFSDEYTWLIYIMNKKGHIVLTIALDANGLFLSQGVITDKDFASAPPKTQKHWERFRKELSEKDVIKFLEKSLGKPIERQSIKKANRVIFLAGRISDLITPMWEITLKDNTVYYYSIKADKVYCIDRKIPWKLTEDIETVKKYRAIMASIYGEPGMESFVDDIAEVRIVLKEVNRE